MRCNLFSVIEKWGWEDEILQQMEAGSPGAVLRPCGCFYVWHESNLNSSLLSRFPLKRRCTCLTSWCLAPWPFAMVSPPSWRIKRSWRWTHLERRLFCCGPLPAGLLSPAGPSRLQRHRRLPDWSVWSKANQCLWHSGTRVWGRLGAAWWLFMFLWCVSASVFRWPMSCASTQPRGASSQTELAL